MSIIPLSAQTLKKQNQMLKDSIGVMQKVIDEKTTANQTLSQENSTLKSKHALLLATKDSLDGAQKNLLGKYKELSVENDQLKDSLFVYRNQNKALRNQVDSLNTSLVNLTNEMNAKLEYLARQEKIWKRSKYFYIAYGMTSLDRGNGQPKLNSDFAFSIGRGKTYYLHKKPLLGMIKFGLDWTFFDIAVAQYEEEDGLYTRDDSDIYKGEISMQFGPSITVNPIDFLKVNLYFRYDPTYSMMFNTNGNEFKGNYGSYFNTGLAASYKVISLGYEYRWGSTSYKIDDENQTWKTSGNYFYISFRF
ncbi:hypothetical protein B5F38_01185 [Barnesiella sp. An22]|nr:hypothetical protein B5F38_01185 [Barnesiella sp. An22]